MSTQEPRTRSANPSLSSENLAPAVPGGLPITHDAIVERHRQIETAPGWFRCSWDREVWPCDAGRLAESRRAIEAEARSAALDEVEAAVGGLLADHRETKHWPLTRNQPRVAADGYIHECRKDGEPWPCKVAQAAAVITALRQGDTE